MPQVSVPRVDQKDTAQEQWHVAIALEQWNTNARIASGRRPLLLWRRRRGGVLRRFVEQDVLDFAQEAFAGAVQTAAAGLAPALRRDASSWPASPAHSARFFDRPILRSSVSTRRILTSISSPILTTSCGFSTLWSASSRDVQQAFQVRLQLDEDAEVGDLGDLALDDLPGQVVLGDRRAATGPRSAA